MNHKRAILYGFLVWVVPFVVAMLIFPFHETERPLFESIMPVSLTAVTVFASIKYFKKSENNSFGTGLCLGLIWLAVGIILDFLMFIWGPIQMTPLDYTKDIGLTYLLIPVITGGFGYLLTKK